MDSEIKKILSGPEDNSGLPHCSAGKLMYDLMKKHNPKSIATVDLNSGNIRTYEEITAFSLNLAGKLRQLGVEKNDLIAIISENRWEYIVVLLAGLFLGAPVYLLNPSYTLYEFRNFLEKSGVKIIFSSLESSKIGDYSEIYVNFNANFVDFIENTHNEFVIEENFDPNQQIAVISNSSGTTGMPKGIMCSHEAFRLSLTYNIDTNLTDLRQDESVLLFAPFHHMYGCNILKLSLGKGAKILIMKKFEPHQFLETIQNYKLRKLHLVPTVVNFLCNSNLTEKYNLSSIEEIACSGAALSDHLYQKIMQKFKNIRMIQQIYGLTETHSAVCMMPLNEYQPKSCGKICPGMRLKIVDLETKQTLGTNEVGEICVAGSVMAGYLNDPEKSQQVLDKKGFLHTGDLGYYDKNDFVYIIDRLKDLIKYKSYQVAPLEIEEILLKHPQIKDCGVVGKPDERFGQLATAFVVKKTNELTEQNICDYLANFVCSQKLLHGGVKFLHEIPKNHLGKVLRNKLRDLL